MSISAENGQYMQGIEPQEGINLFNDLNYGDFVIAFHNPLYDFMFREVENNLKKILVIKRRKKHSEKAGGSLSKREVEKRRAADEKQFKAAENRKEKAMENIMKSMGYNHEGDLFIIQEELKKKTGKKHPIFESHKEFNKPGTENYGKGFDVAKHSISVKEAFQIYDSYMNDSTEIHSLNKDYLKDEEMAFKNAVLFYAKEFYTISYDIKDHYHDVVHTDYFSLPFRQKPITNYFFPILENMINGDERVIKQERF